MGLSLRARLWETPGVPLAARAPTSHALLALPDGFAGSKPRLHPLLSPRAARRATSAAMAAPEAMSRASGRKASGRASQVLSRLRFSRVPLADLAEGGTRVPLGKGVSRTARHLRICVARSLSIAAWSAWADGPASRTAPAFSGIARRAPYGRSLAGTFALAERRSPISTIQSLAETLPVEISQSQCPSARPCLERWSRIALHGYPFGYPFRRSPRASMPIPTVHPRRACKPFGQTERG